MDSASATINVAQIISLPMLGIDQEFIASSNVTMESDKYICVRETFVDNDPNLVIIDMSNSGAVERMQTTANSVLMNPKGEFLALKAQEKGTSQDNLSITNLYTNKGKCTSMSEQVVFWKWITPKMLGIVTDNFVYHWSLEGSSDPDSKFERLYNFKGEPIKNYQCDPSEKWLFLISISPGERKGNLQLFSVEMNESFSGEVHAAAFASFKVAGKENPSTFLFCASKSNDQGTLTSKLRMYELDGNPKLIKEVDMHYPLDSADDFPVSMHISHESSLIHVITDQGLLFVYNLERAEAVCRDRISYSQIILTSDASTVGGVFALNQSGLVLHANVNKATTVPFVSRQITKNEPTSNIDIETRTNPDVDATFAKKRDLDKTLPYPNQDQNQVAARKGKKRVGKKRVKESEGLTQKVHAVFRGADGCRDVEEIVVRKRAQIVGEEERDQGKCDGLMAELNQLKVERDKLRSERDMFKAELDGLKIQPHSGAPENDWAMQDQNTMMELKDRQEILQVFRVILSAQNNLSHAQKNLSQRFWQALADNGSAQGHTPQARAGTRVNVGKGECTNDIPQALAQRNTTKILQEVGHHGSL